MIHITHTASANEVVFIIAHPYYFESKFLEHFPAGVRMLDYHVEYELMNNRNGSRTKGGSVVRFFTNEKSLLKIEPVENGDGDSEKKYRFCTDCQRWTFACSRHCRTCNACTSKVGVLFAGGRCFFVCSKPYRDRYHVISRVFLNRPIAELGNAPHTMLASRSKTANVEKKSIYRRVALSRVSQRCTHSVTWCLSMRPDFVPMTPFWSPGSLPVYIERL